MTRLAVLTFSLFSFSSVAVAQWPGLQAQLEADRVPPGSALERLIAANGAGGGWGAAVREGAMNVAPTSKLRLVVPTTISLVGA